MPIFTTVQIPLTDITITTPPPVQGGYAGDEEGGTFSFVWDGIPGHTTAEVRIGMRAEEPTLLQIPADAIIALIELKGTGEGSAGDLVSVISTLAFIQLDPPIFNFTDHANAIFLTGGGTYPPTPWTVTGPGTGTLVTDRDSFITYYCQVPSSASGIGIYPIGHITSFGVGLLPATCIGVLSSIVLEVTYSVEGEAFCYYNPLTNNFQHTATPPDAPWVLTACPLPGVDPQVSSIAFDITPTFGSINGGD